MKRSIQLFALLVGMLLISVAVPALALFTTPTAASTAGGIVIHGFESGSHLKLTVSGEDIVVNGFLDPSEQVGCSFTHGQNALVCPFAGVNGVELDMGSAADKVEVLDPLPIPLIAHMGGGSDKFIGSDEPDTCYMEGKDGSSCYGNGGNDVCMSGAGGDACYGGPGNDVCKMGAGEDRCLGEAGNDRLYGGPASDHLEGGPGNDILRGEGSSDHLSGGSGNDRLYGGPSPDQLYGESGHDFCDGGPGVGRSHSCEAGPEK